MKITNTNKSPITLPFVANLHRVPDRLGWIEYKGAKIEVVAKPGPRVKAANECIGVLVAKRLELATLQPWLLAGKGQDPCFATTRENIQTLKEAGKSYDDPFWTDEIKTPWFRDAFVFDTLIGNYDRVLKNMCFRGPAPGGEFVFMDHDKILFFEDWTPETLAQSKMAPGHNNLARFLTREVDEPKKAILRKAKSWQKALIGEDFGFLDQLAGFGLLFDDELAPVKDFLGTRAKNLNALVYQHLRPR